MNRREFVKALAGVSLLGWLVRLPSDPEHIGPSIDSIDDEIITPRSSDPEPSIGDVIDEIVKREGWGPAVSYVDSNVYGETACYSFTDARNVIVEEPAPTVFEYWDGYKWIRV